MQCYSNIPKANKEAVLQAINESGDPIIWKDEPDERMKGCACEKDFGSIWSNTNDISAFWKVYNRLTKP